MGKVNQTIARLTPQGEGLLQNPFFEYYYTPASYPPSYVFSSAPSLLAQSKPPGWDMYADGRVPQRFTNVGTPTVEVNLFSESLDDHPFYDNVTVDSPAPGFAVQVVPGNVGGIIQRIPGGRALRGKKVRIYGSYKIQQKDPGDVETELGVSIWLKGFVQSAAIRGETLTAVAADGTNSAGSSTFVSAAADFVTENVGAGDLLWVQDSGGGSEGEWVEIASRTNLTTLEIRGVFLTAHATADYVIGRSDATGPASNVDGNWMSGRGIYVSTVETGNLPGYFVRLQAPVGNTSGGPDWMIRGLDGYENDTFATQADTGVNGATATTTLPGDTFVDMDGGVNFLTDIPNAGAGTAPSTVTLLYIVSLDTYYRVLTVVDANHLLLDGSSQAFPTNGLSGEDWTIDIHRWNSDATRDGVALRLGTGSDSWDPDEFSIGANPPLLTAGGADGSTIQASLTFIEADDWASNPAGSSYELLTDTTVDDGQVHYFDEIVTLPAGFLTNTEDLFVVVMPMDPANIATIDVPVSVAFYGVQMEFLAVQGNSTESRLRKAFTSHRYSGGALRTVSESDQLRDPHLVPTRFPVEALKAVATVGQDIGGDGTTDAILDKFQGSGSKYTRYYTTSSISVGALMIPLPALPSGSNLSRLRLDLDRITGGTSIICSLFEIFESPLGYSPDNGEHSRLLGAPITVASTGGAVTVEWAFDTAGASPDGKLYRHRIGLPWPEDDGISPTPPAPAGTIKAPFHQTSRLWLAVLPFGAGIWDLHILGGYGVAWVDPRMAGKMDIAGSGDL